MFLRFLWCLIASYVNLKSKTSFYSFVYGPVGNLEIYWISRSEINNSWICPIKCIIHRSTLKKGVLIKRGTVSGSVWSWNAATKLLTGCWEKDSVLLTSSWKTPPAARPRFLLNDLELCLKFVIVQSALYQLFEYSPTIPVLVVIHSTNSKWKIHTVIEDAVCSLSQYNR